MRERVELPRLPQCKGCGYQLCVCKVKAGHTEACRFRRTVLNVCDAHGAIACKECRPQPVECDAHQVVACTVCNPCNCKGRG